MKSLETRALALAVPLVVTAMLPACSNKDVYQAIQNNQEMECQKLPATAREECLRDLSGPYEDYERDRQSVLKDEK